MKIGAKLVIWAMIVSVMVPMAAQACTTPSLDGTCVHFYDSPSSVTDGYGSRQWVVDGMTVTASAWTFRADGLAYRGQLGLWSYGLGVQNSTGDNSHTVDNQGWLDFVLFEFSEDLVVDAVGLSSEDSWGADTDINTFVGNDPASLAGYDYLRSLRRGGMDQPGRQLGRLRHAYSRREP